MLSPDLMVQLTNQSTLNPKVASVRRYLLVLKTKKRHNMSYEFLQTLWFILIAILWIGFFFLEGFDFGVGMLLPFLGKKDEERRAIINSIGSVWDGNEVWLLTAGGATFAAFPHWYATMFSGFYLALFLLLVGLILRYLV